MCTWYQPVISLLQELHMVIDTNSVEDPGHQSAVPDFPRPTAREYILRTVAPRPAPYSKSLPHKMYCSLMEGHEFRLAGAFSSDSVFQWYTAPEQLSDEIITQWWMGKVLFVQWDYLKNKNYNLKTFFFVSFAKQSGT